MANKEDTYQNLVIKDDVLDIELLSQYHLSIGISQNELEMGIVDSENHRCLFFELIPITQNISRDAYFETLGKIFDEHPLLPAGFWGSISVFVKNQHFSLIPSEFFSKTKSVDWLCMATGQVEPQGEILAYFHKNLDCHVVYSIPDDIKEWFSQKYSNVQVQFLHQISVLLEGFLRQKPSGKNAVAFAHIDSDWLTLIIFEGKNLLLCNRFKIYEPSDFAKYVGIAFQEFSLNLESDQLIVYGNFEKDAAALQQLDRYFQYVHLGKRPWKLYFGYMFDELEEYKYFETFCTWFCK